MKPLILYFFLQNLSLSLFGQLDSTSKTFIYEALRQEPGSDTMTYTDKLDIHNNSIFFNILKKPKLIGYELIAHKKVELILSQTDKRQLANAIKAAIKFIWYDSLYDNSKMIPSDSLWQYISKCIKKVSRLIERNSDNNEKISLIFTSTLVSQCSTFQFSKPIFLKNRTIAIFYFRRLCSSECGIEDLSVYKLQNGVYKRWITLGGGAF